jgi:hypothetical protein
MATVPGMSEEMQDKKSAPKFFDKNLCYRYASIYASLPKLDSYKGLNFHELDCQSTKERSAFSTALSVKYGTQGLRDSFNINIFEVSGESAKEELNQVNTAKAQLDLAIQLAKNPGPKLFVPSNIKLLEYGSITVSDAPNEFELNSYSYTGVYKDKYVIVIESETVAKTDVKTFEAYIQEYLQSIKLEELK